MVNKRKETQHLKEFLVNELIKASSFLEKMDLSYRKEESLEFINVNACVNLYKSWEATKVRTGVRRAGFSSSALKVTNPCVSDKEWSSLVRRNAQMALLHWSVCDRAPHFLVMEPNMLETDSWEVIMKYFSAPPFIFFHGIISSWNTFQAGEHVGSWLEALT